MNIRESREKRVSHLSTEIVKEIIKMRGQPKELTDSGMVLHASLAEVIGEAVFFITNAAEEILEKQAG